MSEDSHVTEIPVVAMVPTKTVTTVQHFRWDYQNARWISTDLTPTDKNELDALESDLQSLIDSHAQYLARFYREVQQIRDQLSKFNP